MNITRSLSQATEQGKGIKFGLSILFISLLALAGCGGGADTPKATPVATTDLTVTPMKGKFGAGTTVRIKRASDNTVITSGTVAVNGSVTLKMPVNETGPFLIEAGIAGDSYYDESTGFSATIPANTVALRALFTDIASASAVGVTALTEMAVGQIEAASGGITGATANDIIAANATVGNQFGVANPLLPPTIINSTTSGIGGNAADDYALKLAGLAKMTKNGFTSLDALHDLRNDLKDGKLDGLKDNGSGTPIAISSINLPANSSGLTLAQMNSAIATQVVAANAQFGGGTAPTITLTVQDLNAFSPPPNKWPQKPAMPQRAT